MSIIKHIDFEVPDWGELAQPPTNRLSYRGEVMADSPLMYLRLGEASGTTVFDESGQHDATVEGTLTRGITGPLIFDGDTAVSSAGVGGLVISETGWLPVGAAERTIELWFKPNVGTVVFRGINYGNNVAGRRMSFIYTADEISIAVSNCRFGVQGLALPDAWHHTAIVFPSGATRCDEFVLYLNGQPLSSVVIGGVGSTAINTDDTALFINALSTGTWNNCAFDEVAIYETGLSAQRILDHYEAGVNA